MCISDKPKATLLLAHGAGAGCNSEFMQLMNCALSAYQLEVVCFNFSYMQQAIALGKKRPPSRLPVLIDEFVQQVNKHQNNQQALFIGGKSMGGRVASHLAVMEELKAIVNGVVVYGFPFHPPGKPEQTRHAHFSEIKVPTMIVQGERDTFGTGTEIERYTIPQQVSVVYLQDGDHSFKPRKASGIDQQHNIDAAAKHTAEFIEQVAR